ncbi:MAG: internal scaffolding protein [Microviridae sp.]|nr:MAG: internal scaffolding protein [Microviridae sp.]
MKKHPLSDHEAARPLYSFYRPHPRVTYDGTLINHKTGEVYTPPRMTKQSHLEECDINAIMKQYQRTGQIRHVAANAERGQYVDLPGDIDFQESLNTVARAQEAFATLPSKVRDRFGNDPTQFLAFMADPANQDEAIKLGLATRKPDAPAPGASSPPPPPTPPSETSAAAPAPERPQAPKTP